MKKYFIKTLKTLTVSRIENQNQTKQSYILNIILNAVIVLIITGLIIMIYSLILVQSDNYQNQSLPLFSMITILLFFIILKFLSFKGYYKFSTYPLIFILFSLATYISYRWGADSQAGILFYALVIVMSGILIGARFSIISALTTSCSLFIINYLHQQKIISVDRSWIYETWSTSDVTITSIILLIIALVLWLFNRELKRSEIELKNERDLLETRVEEKTAELKINQAKEMAQIYHFAEFGKLSSGLFHDLVNPLTALMLNINKVKMDSEHKPSFDYIKMEIDQAIKASEKMKNYIISVRKQINFQSQKELFSLNQEIEEAIMILNYKAKKKKVGIVFVAENDIKIKGDPAKFNQIVTNLLSNAIDAYDENNINCEIEINLDGADKEIKLVISDYGQGIPSDISSQIFEPFFTTKNNNNNLGLGLSFIKQIIERDFLGTISVYSQVGVGTTFTIKLPTKIYE